MSISNIIQDARSGISDAKGYLDEKVALVTPVGKAPGISGFVFDIERSVELSMTADVTDHYTESNSFFNDHKVIQPIRIRTSGFVGELVLLKTATERIIREVSGRLDKVDAFTGELTDGAFQVAQEAIDQLGTAVSEINRRLDKTQDMVNFFSGESISGSRQKDAYSKVKALFGSETIVSVQTPWEFFPSMIIDGIQIVQGEDSDTVSEFSISLKEFRVADIKTTDYDKDQFPPRNEIQSALPQDTGAVRGTEGERPSFLFSLFGGKK